MSKDSGMTLSISQVSEQTGVSENRLREWQAKGYLSDVQWIPVGSRLHLRFTEKDVQLIIRINSYLEKGFVLKAAVEKARGK
jgi:DNA-binding transcriptional MerR regulator